MPDGAYDVDISDYSTYNADERTITIHQHFTISFFSFKISAEKLKANPKLVSWFECKTSNNEDYVSEPRTLALRDSSVFLYGAAGAYYDELTETGGYQLTVDSQIYGNNCTLTVYDGDTPVLCQRMPFQIATVDIPLLKDIGSHTLRAVVSNGTLEDSAEKTVRVTYEKDPLIVSADVRVNGTGGNLLRSYQKNYGHNRMETVSAQVEVRNDERIETIWIEAHTDSDATKIPLTKREGTEGTYYGSGLAGSISAPVTGVNIYYTLKDKDENGSYYELRRVVGSLSFDDVTYIERESSEDAEPRYEIVSAENNASQTKALNDWERYCELVNNSDSMTYSEFIDGLVDIYGDDDEWSLPPIKEKSRSTAGQPSTETVVGTTSYGGSGITCRMTYRKNSERAEAFLNSDRAISVLIDGEERRVGMEIVMGQTSAEIRFYGINDLFYFPVPDEEETVSADGNFWEYLWHPKANPKVKRPPGTAAERKQAAKELEKKLNDKLTETAFNIDSAQGLFGGDDEDSDDSPTGPNDPCSSDTGKSKKSQDAHDQIDQRYDAAWNFIQTTGNATATTLGMMGAADFTSDALLDDEGVGHQLVDLMRQHEHDLQDVMDELDDDSPTSSDPCDPPTPTSPTTSPKTQKKNPPQHSASFNPLLDPSGIIHEAVADAPVQGVTASIYYKDDTSGEWVPWDSETYDQPSNPMLSLDNGYYGWDVLIGKWKVVFEKDGYFLAESEELDVPPAHTDVNISLVSSTAPTVTGLTAKADGGSVTLTFDKYMLTEDILRDGAVTVLLGDTVPTGTLAAVDPKTTAAGNKQAASVHDVTGGDEVAKQFTYTFDDPLPQGATVKVTVSDEATAYNGMTLTEPFDGSVVIPSP